MPPPPVPLTEEQRALYDVVVARAQTEARGDYAAALAAYAEVSGVPEDIEAVRYALFGPHKPTSSDAIMSLIFGLVGLVVCPIPFAGLAAVLSARRAHRQTQPGIKAGHGLAVAGEVLGWLNIALWAGIAVGLVIMLAT